GVADSRQWNNEFPALARRYRALRYDLRCYGKSDPVPGDFSHLADLVALLDYVGFDAPVVLIGCSMGGVLAMDFALEHPARAKALVMVGSFPSGLWLETPDHPKEAEAAAEARAAQYRASALVAGPARHSSHGPMRRLYCASGEPGRSWPRWRRDSGASTHAPAGIDRSRWGVGGRSVVWTGRSSMGRSW
ncbi:MAG TPA: alpha/beta hydrolase, partial [Acidimicrobiales bacterium]|nr:alpha/beta hydrolase [Acidimicrobiales bacterium]